jgi:hypothetical protein
MRQPLAAVIVIGLAVSGCVPGPVYVQQSAYRPVPLDPARQDECLMIRREIARQQRIAEMSGVMATALVEASVRLNAANVIAGLDTRAAIAGCA